MESEPYRCRRGSETRKKTFAVTTRYDAQEYAELEEAASRAGLTRASYQRVQALAKPRTRSTRRAPVEKKLLGRLLGQIGKIGSNLNQIARAANMGFGVHPDLPRLVGELRRLVPLVMCALGQSSFPVDEP